MKPRARWDGKHWRMLGKGGPNFVHRHMFDWMDYANYWVLK